MRQRNPYANSLRKGQYRQKVIPDKREKYRYDQSKQKDLLEDLNDPESYDTLSENGTIPPVPSQ